MNNGYLDHVLDVLDAHGHPCILMGRYALLWMGAAVLPDLWLDLLIRNSQIAAISEAIKDTGKWLEVPLVRTYKEDYLQPPPRVFNRRDGTFSIKIWSEEATHLSVDPTADERIQNHPFLIETLCCEALNPVLLESDMHPGPEISPDKPFLLKMPNIRFLPHVLCQSANRQPRSKVYIPTISRYLNALIAQDQCINDAPLFIRGPSADVNYLIRYLFLEMPSQREKILPLMNSESRSIMKVMLDNYKRTCKPSYMFQSVQGKTVMVRRD